MKKKLFYNLKKIKIVFKKYSTELGWTVDYLNEIEAWNKGINVTRTRPSYLGRQRRRSAAFRPHSIQSKRPGPSSSPQIQFSFPKLTRNSMIVDKIGRFRLFTARYENWPVETALDSVQKDTLDSANGRRGQHCWFFSSKSTESICYV